MGLEAKSSRLVDLCEPIFATVCNLNRLGRNGARKNVEMISNEVDAAFKEVAKAVALSNQTERQWKEVEPAVCCFVDSMIENSGLPAAKEWREHRLAESRFKILTGDDAFFDDFLDKELGETAGDPDVAERLEVYFACLYLGFEGKYFGVPDQLQRIQSRVAGRVKHLLGSSRQGKVTPEAYDHLNQTKLNLDTAPAIWGAVTLSIFFVVLFFIGTCWMYKDAMTQLARAVGDILSK